VGSCIDTGSVCLALYCVQFITVLFEGLAVYNNHHPTFNLRAGDLVEAYGYLHGKEF
jgi:hypothetical protein